MKNLAINGRFLSQRITGVERYAHELLKHIDELVANGAARLEVTLLVPRNRKFDFVTRAIRVREVGRLTGHAWEQFELPQYCRDHLLFTPAGGAPVIHSDHVITIHDSGYAATPAAYSRGYRSWYQLMHGIVGRKARRVLTDSQFSKGELQRWLGISGEKITVVPLGHEHVRNMPSDSTVLERNSVKPLSYILGVSSLNPNKNFNRLMEAFDLLPGDHRLVIAGAKNSAVFGGSQTLSDGVRWSGYVSDSELRALYENAACFVFPSIYEGFGFPPLEAMALGCPVVLSNAASLPEIGGDVAEYCDPLDSRSIADAISRALRKRLDRNALRQRAEIFKWSECARRTWDILKAELQ